MAACPGGAGSDREYFRRRGPYPQYNSTKTALALLSYILYKFTIIDPEDVLGGEPKPTGGAPSTRTEVRPKITSQEYRDALVQLYDEGLAHYQKHDYTSALECADAGLRTLKLCGTDFNGDDAKAFFLFLKIAEAKDRARQKYLDIMINRDIEGCRSMVDVLVPVLTEDFVEFIEKRRYQLPEEVEYPREIIKRAAEYRKEFSKLLDDFIGRRKRVWMESPQKIYDTGY